MGPKTKQIAYFEGRYAVVDDLKNLAKVYISKYKQTNKPTKKVFINNEQPTLLTG